MQIETKFLDHKLFVMKVLYLFGHPLDKYVPVIHSEARFHGYKVVDSYVFDHRTKLGWGWFGVAVEPLSKENQDLIPLKGEFRVVLHKGAYEGLSRTCEEIKKIDPKADDFLFLYLNDPTVTPEADLETEILFI
jgi:hypothetical protein